ncbi:LysM peptidoglycan-binding domain-containing protein [Paracoccus benzoatiresistens]|uniref:LysM peptidoglycan-binding domain-containing protein n=1 Tax=Paracoccus benzoatiresistens TaxID=2997341 RepID=A0ABT4J539_9RHOB|nr:LysM peptidoglycan-binding domain-containing protein [Paracoccus sp. EF6]MCZ0962238.1 LysM peptidoglycan-binding domain-containing protein [Paracoccus sp. EF6]
MSRIFRLTASAGAAAFLLASCGATGLDPDLRGWMPGALNTADAAARAAPRPQPDSRGIINFPNYQVVVAQSGDTPATIANRLGLNAARLAQHNALPASAPLAAGQVLVLPQRVGGTAGTGGATGGAVTDPFAGQPARNRGTATPTPAASPAPATSASPAQHTVVAGETAWSVARKYNVSVQDLAVWNGLPVSMTLRVGQRLVIPVAGQKAPDVAAVTTLPGSGSPTPRPPSAAEPLPSEKTTPAAEPGPKAPTTDLGATRTAASSAGRFQMPVSGSIIRVYEKGKNDGIDISATAGTAVKAAGRGTVAAVTKDTAGAPIVVVRHDGNLMTVYTGLDGLDVAKGDSVSAGQSIGKAGRGGFVHFEVRQGFDSVDPEKYIN